jgi:hypothetical protein
MTYIYATQTSRAGEAGHSQAYVKTLLELISARRHPFIFPYVIQINIIGLVMQAQFYLKFMR